MRAITPSRIVILGCLALILAGAVACGEGEGGMPEDVTFDPAKERVAALENDTDAVLATLNEYFAAMDAKDTEALGTLFTQRAKVYLGDPKSRPAAEFLAEMPAAWDDWTASTTTYHLGSATLKRPYGWAILTGTVAHHLAAGGDATVDFAATLGMEQQGDKWLISHLHLTEVSP
jgi:ketosteroid isomerase-like protein